MKSVQFLPIFHSFLFLVKRALNNAVFSAATLCRLFRFSHGLFFVGVLPVNKVFSIVHVCV